MKRQKSPCIDVCEFTGPKGWCLGCGRTQQESQKWKAMKPYARNALLKADEIKHLERENIRTALNKANWKISGKGSASELLGMNASTLNSKIAKLGIKKN